jgi:hypothetical protein
MLRALDLRAIVPGGLRQSVHRRVQVAGQAGRLSSPTGRDETALRVGRARQGGAKVTEHRIVG